MALVHYNPFRAMDMMRREMDRFFSPFHNFKDNVNFLDSILMFTRPMTKW